MRNSTKAGIFFGAIFAGIGAISMLFQPVLPSASASESVVSYRLTAERPVMGVSTVAETDIGYQAPVSRIVLDEVTVYGSTPRKPVSKPATSSNRQIREHVLSQGGSPRFPSVLVRDSGPSLDRVMTRKY